MADRLHKTRRELLAALDSQELAEWGIFLEHESDGFKRLHPPAEPDEVRRKIDVTMGALYGHTCNRRKPRR